MCVGLTEDWFSVDPRNFISVNHPSGVKDGPKYMS